MNPPTRVLGNPVVASVEVPHPDVDVYALFWVITCSGHLYNVHRVKRYHGSSGTRMAYWVTRDRTWDAVKELFEARLAALGVPLPRDFFRDKHRPWV